MVTCPSISKLIVKKYTEENKMISKFAEHELFGNEVFAEMDRVLKEEMEVGGMEKKASLEEPKTPSAFSNLVAEIVKCAEKLEEVGHPAADKANNLLADITSSLK